MLERLSEHDFVPASHVSISGNDVNHDGSSRMQSLGEIGTGHHLSLAEGFGQHDHFPAIEAVPLDNGLGIRALIGPAPITLMNKFGCPRGNGCHNRSTDA